MKIGSLAAQRMGGLLLIWQIGFTAFCIFLSSQKNPFLWLTGQALLGICLLQWFVLQHDLGHGGFLRGKWLNAVFGHFASLFSLLPYYPWRQIHHAHHVWTGWKQLDPTLPEVVPEAMPRFLVALMDFCWRCWIPVFALSFSSQTFWNYRRLARLYPDRCSKRRNLFSILFLVTVYALAFFIFGEIMLRCWLTAFIFYLFLSDPLLLSQHTHLDYHSPDGKVVKPIRYRSQPLYTRSVTYPHFISKYILYYFDRHGLHHQQPGVPIYSLAGLESPEENTIHWLDWLRIAKRMPAHRLIFQSFRDTGIKL